MNPQLLKEFCYWVEERHNIYKKKSQGLPKPWTNDEILQTYRFCNVYRELDTVTIWIRKNIREPYADHKHLWFALCVARFINLPQTLQVLKQQDLLVNWNKAIAIAELNKLKEKGIQIYNGAYTISTNGRPVPKNEFICTEVLEPLWRDREHLSEFFESCPFIETASNKLQKYFGFSGFMSYEVTTDMRHTRYLRNAKDIYTWANPGPGAIRGLNRLADRNLNRTASNRLFYVQEMRQLLETVTSYFKERGMPLEMRDIEHSLCEFDKYQRVLLGEGRPRSRYDGKA